MRNAFIDSLMSCAERDSRVALLMAEVGFSVVEPFEKKFPDRFYNTGIAEQDLVTVAAGMAEAGMRPVAYSMSCFLPTRAFEQIKVSLCYQKLPVTLVSVGTGLSYGEMGPTHHAPEESALMRTLPNMTVLFPSDASELREALNWAVGQSEGPVYLSFPKAPSPSLPTHSFAAGQAIRYHSGDDGAILAVGTAVETALKVSELLKGKNLNLSVYGFPTVKPLDEEAVTEAATTGALFIIDEHYEGVGGAIAEIALKHGVAPKRFIDFSLPDVFPDRVLRRSELLEFFGLTEKKITDRIASAYGIL